MFFVPADQGQTRLEISFTQPLLAKAGEFYNNSRIVLAQIDGVSTFEDIIELTGMERLESFRILAHLVEQGVIQKNVTNPGTMSILARNCGT